MNLRHRLNHQLGLLVDFDSTGYFDIAPDELRDNFTSIALLWYIVNIPTTPNHVRCIDRFLWKHSTLFNNQYARFNN